MTNNFNSIKNFLIVFFTLILFFESFLRFKYGFCDAILYRADPLFEYIAEPEQNRRRFGNKVQYNRFSMRSGKIKTTAKKILGFGDSIINGGSLVDQDSLATSILTDTLSRIFNHEIQFLNISAGSWGPDNCFAYLQKFGNFDAKLIVLVVSSHDAYDNMEFRGMVGRSKNYPDKQYISAIYELIDRYIFARIFTKAGRMPELGINKSQEKSPFNPGFSSFYEYAQHHHIPLVFFLHAEKEELQEGTYNEQGKMIIEFASTKNIPIIMDLDNGLSEVHFVDNIHLNARGQKNMAHILLDFLQNNYHF